MRVIALTSLFFALAGLAAHATTTQAPPVEALTATDYEKSFLVFELDPAKSSKGLNSRSRRKVLSRMTIENLENGETQTYYLGAACRGEDVYGYVNGGSLFIEPNYEVYAIFGKDKMMFGRNYLPYIPAHTHGDKQTLNMQVIEQAVKKKSFHVLPQTAEAIIAASDANIPLQVLVEYEEHGHKVTLGFPINIFNSDRVGKRFQITTGAILVPTFPLSGDNIFDSFQRAHIVFNRFDRFELITENVVKVSGVPAFDYKETMVKKADRIYLLTDTPLPDLEAAQDKMEF